MPLGALLEEPEIAESEGREAIRLTVIIPTYNRAAVLAKCLQALKKQSADNESFEVLVSDDGSTDTTRATVQEEAAGSPVAIRYLHQNNSGANAARNHAVRNANGSILLFINDDSIATQDMIAVHLDAHAEYPEDRYAVLGRVTAMPTLPFSPLTPLHLDMAFSALDGQSELDWRAFFTCNVSVKKSLLERGGMFEERIRYHEDLELAERLSHYGLRVIYRPDALAYHDHLLTEDEFLTVAMREANALAVWAQKAPHLKPQLAPLGFEPALPLPKRVFHRIVGIFVNPSTIPAWRVVARSWTNVSPRLYRVIYSRIYESVRRARLQEQLRVC